MRINIVIPVIRHDLLKLLIEGLKAQTMLPGSVVIIDNSNGGSVYRCNLPFRVFTVVPDGNIGVNPAWNLGIGISGDCDALAILNDDIRVGSRFLEKIAAAFDSIPDAGAICPLTETAGEGYRKNIHQAPGCIIMQRREGWAMTIRRDLLDSIPPIPESLRTFCGDDWLWYWSHRLGWSWVKDLSNVIYHKVGASMAENPEIRETLKAEKAEFARIIQRLETS